MWTHECVERVDISMDKWMDGWMRRGWSVRETVRHREAEQIER